MTRAEQIEQAVRGLVERPESPHHPSKSPPPDCLCRWCDIRRALSLPPDDEPARLAAALAVLREIEWGSEIHKPNECPSCGGNKPEGSHAAWDGHFEDCALAAAIGAPTERDSPADITLLTEAQAEDRLRGSLRMEGWHVVDLVTRKCLRRVERDPRPGDYVWDGLYFSFAESERSHERAFDPPRFL